MAASHTHQPAGRKFDPALWLRQWTYYGGMYAVVGDRLHLRRIPELNYWFVRNLDSLRNEMLRGGHGVAIAEHLLALREGECRS